MTSAVLSLAIEKVVAANSASKRTTNRNTNITSSHKGLNAYDIKMAKMRPRQFFKRYPVLNIQLTVARDVDSLAL